MFVGGCSVGGDVRREDESNGRRVEERRVLCIVLCCVVCVVCCVLFVL
jgi:hypothetical protein